MRPMLAATVEDVEKLRYPLLAFPKLDGVRALCYDGKLYSRSAKLIPNQSVQERFRELDKIDGELICGDPTSPTVYRDTVSAVMTIGSIVPAVRYMAFDWFGEPSWEYSERLVSVPEEIRIEPDIVENPEQLLASELKWLTEGYEGVILRCPNAPYKNGRSTLREQGMLKLKRFEDDEAVVVDFEPFRHNANEMKLNELGYASRSSHKANQVELEKLGALVVSWNQIEFKIGTGFTDLERMDIWNKRSEFRGKLVKFKFLRIGMKDAPRHPVFLGWRDSIDLGPTV